MLCEHDLEIDRSDEKNPVYHFTLDVDVEHIRERLLERGTKAGILEADYALLGVWKGMIDGFEDVLDKVVEKMPSVDDEWDLFDVIQTTHVVCDEPEFWFALETQPDLWDPPSFRTDGFLECRRPSAAEAVRANADKYPSFEVEVDGGGMFVRWEGFHFLNFCLASVVEGRYKEKFGKGIRVPVFGSELSFPMRGDELGEMRDELRVCAEDYDNDKLRCDLSEMKDAGLFDRGRLGEFLVLLDVILGAEGVRDTEFVFAGQHIQALEDGSNMPEHIRVMSEIELGVPSYPPLDEDDPDIPF